MDRLNELQSKYRTALESMSQQGVQITQVAMQGDKLLVQGVAPTEDAKNAVWDQIKAVDGTYSDLTCDIKVGSTAGAGTDLHSAPPHAVASGLSEAFRSDQTPAFPSMLSTLFSNSDGQQRAGLLNQLMGSAGPGLLGAVLPGALGNILKGGSTITPEQAQQISPAEVQTMAEHAQKTNPTIIDQVSGFYSQHPKVIQALGAGALAMIMSHSQKQ